MKKSELIEMLSGFNDDDEVHFVEVKGDTNGDLVVDVYEPRRAMRNINDGCIEVVMHYLGEN